MTNETLIGLRKRVAESQKAFDEAAAVYEQRKKQHNANKQALNTAVSLDNAAIDLDKVALAETVIHVSGSYAKAGNDRVSVLRDVIEWIACGSVTDNGRVNPYKDLRTSYFGTKHYDGWHGQRSDHEYGFGPRHGSTIFRISLDAKYRGVRNIEDIPFDARNAVVYYLSHLGLIQKLRELA